MAEPEQKLPDNYGVKFDFEIKTDTRSFDMVDTAAAKAGIAEKNLPSKPSRGQAIARAMLYLMRVCASSIEFPGWSKFSTWEHKRGNEKRNPNYSLKITQVKKLSTDTSVAWRINIADATKRGENMGHVLNVVYDPNTVQVVYFMPGESAVAYDNFGREMQEIVTTEYARFLTHYNDEDLRRVMDAELTEMKALKVIKATNCFIPRDYTEKARKLYQFAQDCGQVVSWLGLDNSEMTRDSLLKDLKTAIFNDMEEYERELDAKLNAKEGDRKRGVKQRERMFNTAVDTIDRIMAMAEYHAEVLGVMAEGIRERRDTLKQKAALFITKDFSANTGIVEVQPAVQAAVKNPDEVF